MAISTNYAFGVAVKQMQDVQTQIAKTQGQLATGTLLGNPSDNPDATASVQRLQSAISRQTSYSKSLTQADNRLAAQETNISGSSGVLIRIKELTLQAANATVSASGRVNISTEIKSLRDQLLAMANARDESGNFIFGGARTGSQPFAANAQGQINYTGDQSQVEVAIGDQSRVAVGGVGSQVFTSVVRDVNGTKTGVGFFQALADLATAVQNGDSANIQRGIGEVDAMHAGVSHPIAQVGTNRSSIEQQQGVIDATSLRLQTTLSGIKDTDYTVAATDLQKQMLSLQAAQSSFAQTAKLSLFDYIK
jgi:flagellar hook-associated protein 3 FlgL